MTSKCVVLQGRLNSTMSDPRNTARFRRSDISDRQVSELIGLSRGLLADGQLVDSEVEYLYKWLAASEVASSNPVLATLFNRLTVIMSDNMVDDDERADLLSTLNQLCGEDFEVGELLKPTTLPLCSPPPEIEFMDRRFAFTGTFTFGSRKECESAAKALGASTASVSGKTDFLIIGDYATDAWKQSSWGRKIEKAVELRDQGRPISIVAETHWKNFL